MKLCLQIEIVWFYDGGNIFDVKWVNVCFVKDKTFYNFLQKETDFFNN